MKLGSKLWVGVLVSLALVMAVASIGRIAGVVGPWDEPPSLFWIVQAGLFDAASLLGIVLTVALMLKHGARPDMVALIHFLAYWDFTHAAWGFSFVDPGLQESSMAAEPGALETLPQGTSIVAAFAGMVLLGFAMSWYLRFCAVFPKPLVSEALESSGDSRVPGWVLVIQRRYLDPSAARSIVKLWIVLGVIGTSVLSAVALAVPGVGFLAEGLSFLMFWPFPAVVFVLGASYLRAGYSLADQRQKQQILWLVNAFVLAAWIFILSILIYPLDRILGLPLARDLGFVTISILPMVVNVCLAFAIFHSGALDPALVVRRSTVYGFLGLIGVFLFAVVEDVVSDRLAGLMGLPDGAGSIVAGGAVAVAFVLLRKRVDRMATSHLPLSRAA